MGPARIHATENNRLSTCIFFMKAELAYMHIVCGQLGANYGIRSIRTLIRFEGGKEVTRTSGAMNASDLKRWIDVP